MNTNNINTHSGRKCNPIGKWLINRKLRKLKLDDTQKEQLETVLEIASSARNDRRFFKTEMQDHLPEMMTEEGFDRDRAVELITTATARQADRAAEIVQAFADLYETLEPWQQQQALAMMQKRRHCRSHRCH